MFTTVALACPRKCPSFAKVDTILTPWVYYGFWQETFGSRAESKEMTAVAQQELEAFVSSTRAAEKSSGYVQ